MSGLSVMLYHVWSVMNGPIMYIAPKFDQFNILDTECYHIVMILYEVGTDPKNFMGVKCNSMNL